MNQAAQAIFHAILYFGSVLAILALFGSVIAVVLWVLKKLLWVLVRFIRAFTKE
jgi:hypothetical protein